MNIKKELKIEKNITLGSKYQNTLNKCAKRHIERNQLPVKTQDMTFMYEMDYDVIKNRIANQIQRAIEDGVEIDNTIAGFEKILSFNPRYCIMLNRQEERALVKAIQSGDNQDYLMSLAITFLSPRLKVVYDKFCKAITIYSLQEDAIQDLVFGLYQLIIGFDFEKTTAGLTPQYMNYKLCRAISDDLRENRSIKMAAETWAKVTEFIGHPEDYNLTIDEIVKKYHASKGLASIMQTFVSQGDVVTSLDVEMPNNNCAGNGEVCTLSDFIKDNNSSNDYDDIELDMVLKDILNEEQYKILKLRMQGFSHASIAEELGVKTTRVIQYHLNTIKKILVEKFDVDVSEYSSYNRCSA